MVLISYWAQRYLGRGCLVYLMSQMKLKKFRPLACSLNIILIACMQYFVDLHVQKRGSVTSPTTPTSAGPSSLVIQVSVSVYSLLLRLPGNMNVVCLGWCTMTCTGWLFPSECSTSLLWQSIVVFGTELQGISRRLLCASLWSCWSPAPAICQMSSTVSSASLPHSTFETKSLDFTAWLSAGSICWPWTISARPEDISVC